MTQNKDWPNTYWSEEYSSWVNQKGNFHRAAVAHLGHRTEKDYEYVLGMHGSLFGLHESTDLSPTHVRVRWSNGWPSGDSAYVCTLEEMSDEMWEQGAVEYSHLVST